MRVQKYISRAGAASRRQAEVLMRDGRITVNGVPVTVMGTLVTPGVDTVMLDGRVVEVAPRRWLVFHKPRGVLCTRGDPHGGETIYALRPNSARSLRYVGRLDRDTSGLLLLTNDGDMGFALAHPSGGVEMVAGQITAPGAAVAEAWHRAGRRLCAAQVGPQGPIRRRGLGCEAGPGGRPKAGGAAAAEGGGASGGGTRTHALRPLPSGKTEARHLEAGAHIGTCGGARPDPARGPRPVASLEEMEWLS